MPVEKPKPEPPKPVEDVIAMKPKEPEPPKEEKKPEPPKPEPPKPEVKKPEPPKPEPPKPEVKKVEPPKPPPPKPVPKKDPVDSLLDDILKNNDRNPAIKTPQQSAAAGRKEITRQAPTAPELAAGRDGERDRGRAPEDPAVLEHASAAPGRRRS